jgi:hypothetical protein
MVPLILAAIAAAGTVIIARAGSRASAPRRSSRARQSRARQSTRTHREERTVPAREREEYLDAWVTAVPVYGLGRRSEDPYGWESYAQSSETRDVVDWVYPPVLYFNGEPLPDDRQPTRHRKVWELATTAEAIMEARKTANVRVVVPLLFAGTPLENTGFHLPGSRPGEYVEVGAHGYIGAVLEARGIKVWVAPDGLPPHPGGPEPVPLSNRPNVE